MPEVLVSDKKIFACGCGFASATKSGLSNHRKTCTQTDAIVPATAETTAAIQAVKIDPPLTSTDRTQFSKRILDRSKSILLALTEELDGSPDRVLEGLRREKGITLTVQQIQELVEGMDRQIDSEVGDFISDEEEKIKVEIADLDEKYDEIERDMKERHHKEWRDMREQKKAKILKIRQSLKNVKEKVTEEKVGDLKKQRDQYKLKLIRTRQLEQEIKFTQEQRVALLRRQRGRLTHIISDATNRALEQLLITTDRQVAGKLVEQIPTAGEALKMCTSPEGFTAFVKLLDPTHALPAPANMEIDAETLKQAKLEEEIMAEKEERVNIDTESTRDHDDVYEGGDDEDNDEDSDGDYERGRVDSNRRRRN